MSEAFEFTQQPEEQPTPQPQEGPENGTAPEGENAPEEQEKKPPEDVFYWLNALTTALVCLVIVFTFFGRLTRVDGESMTNTLQHNQLLLVWSLGYQPEQGDIVVLNKTTAQHLGGVAIVKRVIATGGQTVDIDYDTSSVYVDGVRLEEDYIKEPMLDITSNEMYAQTHFEVPEGSIFVMGDNRNNSSDSRDVTLGTVDERYVLGRALWVLLPFQRSLLLSVLPPFISGYCFASISQYFSALIIQDCKHPASERFVFPQIFHFLPCSHYSLAHCIFRILSVPYRIKSKLIQIRINPGI